MRVAGVRGDVSWSRQGPAGSPWSAPATQPRTPSRIVPLTCGFAVGDALPSAATGGRRTPSTDHAGDGATRSKGTIDMTRTSANSTDRRNTNTCPVSGVDANPMRTVSGDHTSTGAGSGPRHDDDPAGPPPACSRQEGSSPARVRTVPRDGTVVWTTPILEYQPVLTSQDYAVLARLRDQARADIARRTTDLPDAA